MDDFDNVAGNDRVLRYVGEISERLTDVLTGDVDVQVTIGESVRDNLFLVPNGTFDNRSTTVTSGGTEVVSTLQSSYVDARGMWHRHVKHSSEARRLQETVSTCSAEYTPVTVDVTMRTPQTTEWVEQVVRDAGNAATNTFSESVYQCGETTLEPEIVAPIMRVDAPPPRAFVRSNPPPAPRGTRNEFDAAALGFFVTLALLFCCILACVAWGATRWRERDDDAEPVRPRFLAAAEAILGRQPWMERFSQQSFPKEDKAYHRIET